MRFDSLRAIALMRQPGLKTGGTQRPPGPSDGACRRRGSRSAARRPGSPGLGCAASPAAATVSPLHFHASARAGRNPPISPLAVQALRPEGNKKKGNIWKRQLGSQVGTAPPPRDIPRVPAALPPSRGASSRGPWLPWGLPGHGQCPHRRLGPPQTGTTGDLRCIPPCSVALVLKTALEVWGAVPAA